MSEILFIAWKYSLRFSLEILAVLPPALLLMALLDIWMPVHAVEAHLGKDSGARGMALALLMGSVAAGPLFMAFPAALSFLNKGGRTANAVIFLGSWATIKLPMLMMESRFLGWRFSLLRLALTVPFIVMTGLLMEKWRLHAKTIPKSSSPHAKGFSYRA